MEIFKYQCECCWFKWIPRSEKKPKRCPFCKSRRWESGGEIRKNYDFGSMEINEVRLITWSSDLRGQPDLMANRKMNIALASYSSRTGRKFKRSPTSRGLEITRLS